MCEVPWTDERNIFATDHHGLVYSFLRNNYLSEDDYYDIVIFGYLKAVEDYFNKPELQQYSFATIAWKAMLRSLSRHYKSENCLKRKADVVSLNVSFIDGGRPLEETISESHPLMLQLETKLLLHDLAGRVSRQQMDMVRLKSSGYGIREIAKDQKVSMKQVKQLLEEVRSILTEMCYE